jgi:hypothetical protein
MAHDRADYPGNHAWKYSSGNRHRVYYKNPNNWSNNFNPRVLDAMDAWNNVSGSTMSFDLAGFAASGIWACGAPYDFMTKASISSGYAGLTHSCAAPDSTVLIRFNEDKDWYTGASTPSTDGYIDVQGLTEHELGHSMQAWAECTNAQDEDPCPGYHYDSEHNGLICSNEDATRSTMCRYLPDPSSKARSLEEHDRDLIQAAY